uniref:Hflx-type G domain-containing protein n=1 Tax=Plectus sambesii TaxID=2011161 RepID=A0A914VZG0_9BILA
MHEHRLQKKLSSVLADRQAKRDERLNPRGFQQSKKPTIAVIGYTNAGKTSLIRCLTGDERLRPEDRLFATLDTTVYSGKLPSQMPVYFADTIGFISDLPHSLIASFTATLDDVRHAHLLVHIRDISHPNTVAQRDQVLETLDGLRLPSALIDNMVEARNKFDRISDERRAEVEEDTLADPNAVVTSCTTGRGLPELCSLIEQRIFKLIGCEVRKFKLPIDSAAVGYFYREVALLSDPEPSPCGRFLFFTAAMDNVQFEKFQTRFGAYRKQPSTSDRK